ncbi:MAG: VCBS repeat-containing protein, partial [Planctomycetes bacterium]|nr:VCBS repeat-containing protein [Planctomycetota bacterium]
MTQEVGLNFVHDAGPEGTYFMPQIMGSGAALFDYDNDGRLDIYLLQMGGPDSKSTNRLYHQEANGHFTDVSRGSGLDVAGFNTGVAIGDVNNDGWPDVLVTQYGGVKLFLNNGHGTFTDVSREAGLSNLAWGTSAAFVDYDRDGWLDLVVVNYVAYPGATVCQDHLGKREFCDPKSFSGSLTRLFHNLGPAGGKGGVRFEDVTEKSGLGRLREPGLGVACADFDGDGWPDIFVANDGQPNCLWINQHNGTFKEEAVVRGLAYNHLGQAQANMGIALGDVDGDGLFDLYVTHLGSEGNVLWKQGPRGVFQDQTMAAGLGGPEARATGFGAVFGDFDQDGAPDLAFVNGRVYRAEAVPGVDLPVYWREYAEPNRLFANDGRGRFRDISPQNPAFCGRPGIYRGLAYGDVDGDGALDLLVTETAGPARL